MNNYPETIQKIHKEFLTAGDKLLADSKKILELEVVDKSVRLARLGFEKTAEVKEYSIIKTQKETAKEQAERIEYYHQNYPLNKFITMDVVKRICKKYTLIMGSIADFTGFVPSKNLKEIESFNLKHSDRINTYQIKKVSFYEGISGSNTIRQTRKYVKENPFIFTEENFGYGTYGHWEIHNMLKGVAGASIQSTIADKLGNDLMICASPKEMNVQKIRFMFVKPDPIVLKPVKGGFLIVTAWGNESKDPEIMNEKLN